MRVKLKEQGKARSLRQQGLSYSEIAKRVNVAKSSVSVWCRDVKLSKSQIDRLKQSKLEAAARGRETMRKLGFSWRRSIYRPAKPAPLASEIRRLYWEKEFSITEIVNKLDTSFWVIYNLMKRNNIPRRSGSESNYVTNKYKPQFRIKENLTLEEENLRIAGIMLYWAEGAKNGNTVNFVNSDSDMIKLFLKFLRKICGISEERLRLYLYVYSYQSLDEIKDYWHRITNIPISQFIKPYVRKGNPNKSGRKLPYGVVHVRYSDTRLLGLIKNWINEYIAKANFK